MIYKRFSFLIILRITLIIGNVLLLGWIFGDMRLFFNQVILCLILAAQVAELIHFVNHTNRELSRLFLAIRHSDFSISFTDLLRGDSFRELQHSLSEIIRAYKQVKIEKEVQYQFLQMLVQQIHIGIITLENDNIVLINPTAERILNIGGMKNWKLMEQLNPIMANEFRQIGDHGRRLLELKSLDEPKVLSVDVRTLIVLDKPHKLITLQDINSEIEQKEIEAWHKLIRILTHEIMNSVTPVSSLTETIQGMLTDKEGNQKKSASLTDEIISDILFSLSTIQKRSDGLLHFVDNYRKLTRVPKPIVETVEVKAFLTGIENLMRPELLRHGVNLTITLPDNPLTFSFDPKLIEQVVINLITNSLQALHNQSVKTIELAAYVLETTPVIEVADNGEGIPEKELKEIFVPFFSTKKNGSGIGLSLSKQIMSVHGGTIKVHSKLNEGTSVQLRFRK